MENYNKELESNLLKMIKQKEEADKRLLKIEIVMGIASIIPLISAVCFVNLVSLPETTAAIFVLVSLLPLLIVAPFALKIEQKAGYYVCGKCGHKHVPKYQSVLWAMHINRTRYMKCPNCNKMSWQKKVINKDS